MIGLDTNVLVRYFQKDDPAQTERASALIASFTAERPGFIASSVLMELVWVLTSKYRISRSDIGEILLRLMLSNEVMIEQASIVWEALRIYRSSRADFADCLIERIGAAAGCDYTVTYDQIAAKTAGMRLLK
ncbi:MAG: type II toxin-antitoxin system VapC family toxin [Silvibacterium sp.]